MTRRIRTRVKCTPAILGKILAALRLGSPVDTAALMAGVPPRTLRQWVAEHEDVALAVAEAQANCEYEDLQVIDRAVHADNNPKLAVETAKWRRERLNPAVFGRTSRNDMWTRAELIRELAEELQREGLNVTEEQLLKEYAQLERRALPGGKKPAQQ